jgi:NAD dependent epimerase/dehydratase family enzyme
MVLAGQRVLPEALRASGFSWRDPVLEPALRSLLGKEDAGA